MNKYRARRVSEDGFTFDSAAEARRYRELKLLERAGEIADLTVHPTYPIDVNGVRICVYEADFSYHDVARGGFVVEDVKGMRLPVYRLKRQLVKALYGIEITEIEA